MTIKSYSDLNSLELDTLREIGSIGHREWPLPHCPH